MFRFLFVMIGLAACVITGCTDQRQIEKLGFSHSVGFDLIKGEEEEERLQVTLVIPSMENQVDKKKQVLTTVSKSSKEARLKLSQQSDKRIVSGQVRNTLFGIALAKDGLWKHIDTFVRDPAIGPNVKLTIVNGNAHELLSRDYPQHALTGRYIDKLIEKEIQGQTVPEATIYSWSRDYYDDGIDPVAPLIYSLQDHVRIDGVALFNEDKYVGKIDPIHAVIFSFLRGDFRQGELYMEIPDEKKKGKEIVLLSSIINKRNVDVERLAGPQKFRVTMRMTIKGSVLEYLGERKLSNDAQKKELEHAIEKYIRQTSEQLTAHMQKVKADGMGIGKAVRNHVSYEEWDKMNWDEVYSKLKFEFQVKVKIRDNGKFK